MPTRLTRSGRRHPVIEIHWNGKIEARPWGPENAGVKTAPQWNIAQDRGKGSTKAQRERHFGNNLKTIPPTVPLSYAETLRA